MARLCRYRALRGAVEVGVDVINARFFTALRSVLNDGSWENFNISITQAGLAIHDGEAVNSRKRRLSIHDCKSNQFTRLFVHKDGAKGEKQRFYVPFGVLIAEGYSHESVAVRA